MATAVRDVWVTSVSVTGYKKEGGRRRAWVYVIETCWTDQTRFEIYRRYSDFFAFQHTLLTLFPREAGKYDRLDRCIPYLPTADNVLQLLGGNFSAKHLESRLRTINHYCETILVKLEPHLSRSEYVLQFFKCQPGDEQLLGRSRPPSMHPQIIPAGSVFEEYQVAIDFAATTEEHLSVQVGETVSVISKDSSDWWYVTKDAKLTGWVPKSYLQRITGDTEAFLDDPEEWTDIGTTDRRRSHLAIADYETTDPSQLAFKEGAEVTVLDKEEDGWWLAVVDNRVGWVPSSFLEPLVGETEECVEESSDEVVIPADEEAEVGPSSMRFWAVRKYTAALPDEVDLPLYAEVEVVNMNYSGWWFVRLAGSEGLAPATYLSPIDPRAAESAVEDEEKPMIEGERRGSFIKREYMHIKLPPPRSESVRKLSRRYCKDGAMTAQKAPMLINEMHISGEEHCDLAGNCSVPLLRQSSENMEGVDADADGAVPLSHSPVLSAKLDSNGGNVEVVSSLPRSSPVLSKKPQSFNYSPTSSPRSSPMVSGQLSAEAPARNSPTAWKKFGKTLSVDVADVSCGPKSRENQSWSLKDEDTREQARATIYCRLN